MKPVERRTINRNELILRFGFSGRTLRRLRIHDDLDQRFPQPCMVLNTLELWDLSDVDAWEERQRARGPRKWAKPPMGKENADQT